MLGILGCTWYKKGTLFVVVLVWLFPLFNVEINVKIIIRVTAWIKTVESTPRDLKIVIKISIWIMALNLNIYSSCYATSIRAYINNKI